MSTPRLSLLVLRFRDLDAAVRFYERLGLSFTRERHGSGLEHYSCSLDGTLLELYPQPEASGGSTGTRIGFLVAELEAHTHFFTTEAIKAGKMKNVVELEA